MLLLAHALTSPVVYVHGLIMDEVMPYLNVSLANHFIKSSTQRPQIPPRKCSNMQH